MPGKSDQFDEIKRKLRKLKKSEIKIRFGGSVHAANYKLQKSGQPEHIPLVWDQFFHINGHEYKKGRYSLTDIAAMNSDEYKKVIDEFYFMVYYRYYTENGITGAHLYDPEILKWMGLPLDAGADDIKRKFRELAKKHHPDTGGDEAGFIRLMNNYRKLTE